MIPLPRMRPNRADARRGSSFEKPFRDARLGPTQPTDPPGCASLGEWSQPGQARMTQFAFDDRRATVKHNSRPTTPVASPGLWDAATGAFHGALLHRAMVARGWTVRDFAGQARLNICSVYNAIHGRPVRDGTAIRIFETLEKRAPMTVVLDRVEIDALEPDPRGGR